MTTAAETAEATTAILESGAIMLGAALVFVTLFRRLKLGATLGYIVAGALIGPQILGLVKDPEQLTSVAEISIALLLFIVGLELQPSRLWRLRKDIFGLGLAQVVLCGLALTMAAIYGQVVVDDAIVARFVSERFRGRAYGASYTLGFAVSALAIPLMGYLHAQGAGFAPVLALTAACGVMLVACAVGFSLAVARR